MLELTGPEVSLDWQRWGGVGRDDATTRIGALPGMTGGPNLGGHQVATDVLPDHDPAFELVAEVLDYGQDFACFQNHDFIVFLVHNHILNSSIGMAGSGFNGFPDEGKAAGRREFVGAGKAQKTNFSTQLNLHEA